MRLHGRAIRARCPQTTIEVLTPDFLRKDGAVETVVAQVKSVTVETDDPMHASTVLTLKAVIAQMLEIQPPFVYWQSGEAPKAKTVRVKAGKDFAVKELKLSPTSPGFEANVKKIGDGEFKIDIQPHDTAHMVATTFVVQPDDSDKKFYVTARVMTSAPAPAPPATTAVQP